jgi:hypothetical protein
MFFNDDNKSNISFILFSNKFNVSILSFLTHFKFVLLLEAIIHYNMGFSKLYNKFSQIKSECDVKKLENDLKLDELVSNKIKINDELTIYVPDFNELIMMIIIVILFYFVIDNFLIDNLKKIII